MQALSPARTPNHRPLRKLALLSDWFLPRQGGIESQMHDLAHHLTLAGHEVHVITPIPGPTQMSGFRIHRLHAARMPLFGFVFTPQPFRAIADLLRRERYEVVHCHTSYIAPIAFGGTYVSQRLGIPTVITFHSVLAHFAHVLAASNHWLHWSDWPVLFSGVSQVVNHALEPLVKPKPVYMLPNAIDITFWQQTAPSAPSAHEVVLITVTRFSPRKRVVALLKLVAALRPHLPGITFKLLIVGDGPLRPAIEYMVAALGLSAVVTLLGYQPRAKIREWFTRAHIFVSACAIESFGLAALEARTAGLPVVARTSGVVQFIRHGQEGLLAHTDAELAYQLHTLITDRQLRKTIAEHNRTTQPAFGWDSVLPQHLSLYRTAMEITHA